LHGKANIVADEGWEGVLYRNGRPSVKPMEITAIPYYAWDNRAPGEMRVWVRELSG
jgi:DUF1680 family protein